MTQIQVFTNEIKDGLADIIKSQASVAYCSQPTVHTGTNKLVNKRVLDSIKSIAQNEGQKDLYYLETVLVSTGWNKNDDVFLPQYTWEARNTPEDKQFNFMHDENDIIGHITGSYVISKDGQLLEDSETAPEDFDIITQAVLYNSWTNPENQERMERIIAEIKENKWYVSMECLFAGFDYAILDNEGNGKVIARDEESSFLTKYLRAYGGDGQYQGYKIGRALRNIVFSGKGLVSQPANPRSIILNSHSVASFKDNIPNFSIGENLMPLEVTTLEKQLADVKAELALAKDENKVIKAQIEEAKNKEFADKIKAFETELSEKTQTVAEMEEVVATAKTRIAELEAALAKSNEDLAAAMKNMEEMKKKEKMQKRKASLVEAGLTDEEIEESLAKFIDFSDDSFDFIVAMMAKGKKKAKCSDDEDEDEMDDKSKCSQTQASEAVDSVKTEEATLVVAQDDSEINKVRASISSWIENNVLVSKKK